MNSVSHSPIDATQYDRNACEIGIVHLGFGAFHRAHQAVYVDDYMNVSGDLRWGIAAVNLRASEAEQLNAAQRDIDLHDGYFLKSFSPDGQVALRRVRSHNALEDWSADKDKAEALLSRASVHLVTITVTESGYYTDPMGDLDLSDPIIAAEIRGEQTDSVYAYLAAALGKRMNSTGAPVTIACCDNIRQNGKMLKRNLGAYLRACEHDTLATWMHDNVAFPCSMVDRITPRSPAALGLELSALVGDKVAAPIMAEDFIQWVLQDIAAGPMPDLAVAGVTVTADVDPYEETKIRVLNGGHTALCYLAALEGLDTFDEAMNVPYLKDHFEGFESNEVLPAIAITLPFSKHDYLEKIAKRFGNKAIGDTIARICADGMAKFPIFVRPTLEGCFASGRLPVFTIRSIASWYVFARHVDAGNIPFEYAEPSWPELEAMLGTDTFLTSQRLWGDIPQKHPEFADTLRREISDLEAKWPV